MPVTQFAPNISVVLAFPNRVSPSLSVLRSVAPLAARWSLLSFVFYRSVVLVVVRPMWALVVKLRQSPEVSTKIPCLRTLMHPSRLSLTACREWQRPRLPSRPSLLVKTRLGPGPVGPLIGSLCISICRPLRQPTVLPVPVPSSLKTKIWLLRGPFTLPTGTRCIQLRPKDVRQLMRQLGLLERYSLVTTLGVPIIPAVSMTVLWKRPPSS